MPTPYEQTFVDAFEDEMQKIAVEMYKAAGLSYDQMKALGLMGGAVIGYESLRRANQDRRMGRMMRIQQNTGF